jgi:hypothetical protein
VDRRLLRQDGGRVELSHVYVLGLNLSCKSVFCTQLIRSNRSCRVKVESSELKHLSSSSAQKRSEITWSVRAYPIYKPVLQPRLRRHQRKSILPISPILHTNQPYVLKVQRLIRSRLRTAMCQPMSTAGAVTKRSSIVAARCCNMVAWSTYIDDEEC